MEAFPRELLDVRLEGQLSIQRNPEHLTFVLALQHLAAKTELDNPQPLRLVRHKYDADSYCLSNTGFISQYSGVS